MGVFFHCILLHLGTVGNTLLIGAWALHPCIPGIFGLWASLWRYQKQVSLDLGHSNPATGFVHRITTNNTFFQVLPSEMFDPGCTFRPFRP